MNRLYFGDNLDILRNRDYMPDESVDLIYLDPPFNSNRSCRTLRPAPLAAIVHPWIMSVHGRR